jgi:hypothetical protein
MNEHRLLLLFLLSIIISLAFCRCNEEQRFLNRHIGVRVILEVLRYHGGNDEYH